MNTKQLFQEYVLNTYNRVGPVFVRGKGSWLWDEKGRKYLDLFPGWGVSILGHAHPGLAKVISQQAKTLLHLPNNLIFPQQAKLAQEIIKQSFPAKVFFSNSGAESIEGLVKLSRLYGKVRGRYEIVTMKNSFHGRTFAALSATGQAKYKEPFMPILPSFVEAEFNNFGDFATKVNERTVGVLMELVQGEGGINIALPEYVKQVKAFCEEKQLLFMVDEVQTCMGRTGKMFAFQHYGVTPDIMAISKGLGAGVPIGAIVAGPKVYDLIKPGMHASTFGGNPLVTAAGLEVFRIIKKEKLPANVKKSAAYLVKRLVAMQKRFPLIKEVRGVGIMIGVELDRESFPVFLKALENGLIINSTHVNVLRIMPALNASAKELELGMDILEETLNSKP